MSVSRGEVGGGRMSAFTVRGTGSTIVGGSWGRVGGGRMVMRVAGGGVSGDVAVLVGVAAMFARSVASSIAGPQSEGAWSNESPVVPINHTHSVTIP